MGRKHACELEVVFSEGKKRYHAFPFPPWGVLIWVVFYTFLFFSFFPLLSALLGMMGLGSEPEAACLSSKQALIFAAKPGWTDKRKPLTQ